MTIVMVTYHDKYLYTVSVGALKGVAVANSMEFLFQPTYEFITAFKKNLPRKGGSTVIHFRLRVFSFVDRISYK